MPNDTGPKSSLNQYYNFQIFCNRICQSSFFGDFSDFRIRAQGHCWDCVFAAFDHQSLQKICFGTFFEKGAKDDFHFKLSNEIRMIWNNVIQMLWPAFRFSSRQFGEFDRSPRSRPSFLGHRRSIRPRAIRPADPWVQPGIRRGIRWRPVASKPPTGGKSPGAGAARRRAGGVGAQ